MALTRNATFRQLTAFHTVARLGSVSAAANELHLTQPAVSLQIAALEESARTPLLQREGRGVRLTEAGVRLDAYARRILDLWREAGEEMASLRGEFAGTLRVGAVTTAEYLLPTLLVTFANEHPRVKVKLEAGNRDVIIRMLSRHEIDIAIMGRPPTELKTVAAPFAKHPMAFLAAPGHPIMRGPPATMATLADTPLLVRERGAGTRTTLEGLFSKSRRPLRIGSELSSNEAIKQMAAAGFGVAFLSLHTCQLELDAGVLELVPMAGNPIERDWYVMHLAARQLPQVASAFEQFLRERGQHEIVRLLAAVPQAARSRQHRPAQRRRAPAASGRIRG